MKTKFYLNGKKVSKKALVEMFGKEAIDRRIKEAKETFMMDPNIENSWWMGYGFMGFAGMLTIYFE